MKSGLENTERGDEWTVLADKVCGGATALPFTLFTCPINANMSAAEKHLLYLSLYKRAVHAVTADVEAIEEGEAQISYNFAMTSSCMALCPRTAEGMRIEDGVGHEIGHLALNGTVLAGTALVKTQAEWDALRTSNTILPTVLVKIGVPSVGSSS